MADGITTTMKTRIREIIETVTFDYNGSSTTPNAAQFQPPKGNDGELPLFILESPARDVIDPREALAGKYTITTNIAIRALINRIGQKGAAQIELNRDNIKDAVVARFLPAWKLQLLNNSDFLQAPAGSGVQSAVMTGVLPITQPYPQGGDAGETYYQLVFNLQVVYEVLCRS